MKTTISRSIFREEWRVASYARLSREDKLYGKSDSIVSQRRLIEDWARASGASIVASYEDDGFSGADFERPGFNQMMLDAHGGLFDTIVVKDLSRFGRSYLDCGSLIERELPKLGIRLYSIGDSFDSMEAWDYNTALLFPMKNLMNELYVASTSEKVRASLKAKRERGEFVGNFTPYGYARDPHDRHRLSVDEGAAPVVREIFRLKTEGRSAAEIARLLNRDRVPCPSAYRRNAGSRHRSPFNRTSCPQWHAKTVLRILRDETYTGNLLQGKTRRPNWRIHHGVPVPRDLWAVKAHAHDAIVSDEVYRRANALIAASAPAKDDHLGELPVIIPYKVHLTCGGCGGAMKRIQVTSREKRYVYYTCSTHRRSVHECSSHSIREEAYLSQLQHLLDSGTKTGRTPPLPDDPDAPVHALVDEKGIVRLAQA